VVLLHRHPEAIGGTTVMTDDVGGARLATQHLLEHGHERIACVGGPEKALVSGDPVADHVVGWRQAMREADLPTQGLLFHTPYNRYDAYRVGLELLRDASRPPAVFCATDDQAIGILRAARDLRIDVPGQVAVVGFDNVKEAALVDPPLTTVASDRMAMARAAMDAVEDSAQSKGTHDERQRRFPAQLVARASCGCA
jgi:LacI family transcriptional regulator